MNINEFRYQLRLKQAVLQAHDAAISNTLDEIECPRADDETPAADDYRMNEEAMFEKYWKIVSEMQ